MAPVPDDASIATIRAAVATIAPAVDGRPGALDLGVDRHVCDLMEQSLEGAVDLVATLIDAYAADVRPGARFAELDDEERTAVLRAMSSDESQDVREAVDTILVFALGGLYSEWSGYDRATGRLQPPATWERMGFHPAAGHPEYRRDA